MAAGCDDFVRKPFQDHVIFEKLAAYLGVRYVYQVVAADHEAMTVEPVDLTTESFRVMPVAWVRQLYDAAVQADTVLLEQQIEQIPDQYAALSQQLTHKVKTYDYDSIVDLTAPLLETA